MLNRILFLLLIAIFLLNCSPNINSLEQWSNDIKSQIANVDFNLEFLQNIGPGTIGEPIIGIQFFIEFKTNPNVYQIDKIEVSSSNYNYAWASGTDSTNIFDNTICSNEYVADYYDMGSAISFPLGNIKLFYAQKIKSMNFIKMYMCEIIRIYLEAFQIRKT
jgi:hypothetical protein